MKRRKEGTMSKERRMVDMWGEGSRKEHHHTGRENADTDRPINKAQRQYIN